MLDLTYDNISIEIYHCKIFTRCRVFVKGVGDIIYLKLPNKKKADFQAKNLPPQLKKLRRCFCLYIDLILIVKNAIFEADFYAKRKNQRIYFDFRKKPLDNLPLGA